MPCMKALTAAISRFASSFKLEHSSALSGVPATLTPALLGSLAFAAIMAVVAVQTLRNRAWFLWALASASMLQCAGFIASAFHSYDGTNHLAFLASFATITLAPLFLSIAVFNTFGRLSQTVMPEAIKKSGSHWVGFTQRCGTFVLLPCLLPFAMFICSFSNLAKFLSPLPIDGGRHEAFRRLLNYEVGLAQLEKAHASQAVLCLIFAVMTSIFALKSRSWAVETVNVRNKNWRELLHGVTLANSLVLVRACYKIYECREIVASRAALGDNGMLFWLFDVLPMLAALVMFCGIKPTSYLPDGSSASLLLDVESLCKDEKAELELLHTKQ